MPLMLALISALAAEPLYHDGTARRAESVLTRDTDVRPETVQPMPLWLGDRLDVVGGLRASACTTPASGQALAAGLRDAERFAEVDALDAAWEAAQRAIALLPCLDVPVRPWEAAGAHDLASALATRRGAAPGVAVAEARQALAYDPSHPFTHQVEAGVIEAARAASGAPSTLHLPPGDRRWQILVDGRPTEGSQALLVPGRHLLQVLDRRVRTLVIDVGDTPDAGALVLPEVAPTDLALDDADTRAWLARALDRFGPAEGASWLVLRDQVWRVDPSVPGWQRYDRRAPRAVRPALLTVLGATVAGSAGLAGWSWATWSTLDGCGVRPVPGPCAAVVDAGTGLIVDAEGWSRARATHLTTAVVGTVGVALSGVALGVVASRSRAPHAVELSLALRPDGAGVAVHVPLGGAR